MSRLTNALIIIQKNNNKKVTEKVIFHPFAQKSPVNGFFTKFGTNFPHVDVPDKLCLNLFNGFDFTWGQSFHFSHRKLTSPL